MTDVGPTASPSLTVLLPTLILGGNGDLNPETPLRRQPYWTEPVNLRHKVQSFIRIGNWVVKVKILMFFLFINDYTLFYIHVPTSCIITTIIFF